ncbi:MAG: hypothetical protein JRN66_07880 [Nitrososphaerota archaeon]|jgi:nitrogen fixation-related uncharacterized protein|nr:hypothetical protein [Nitrososphaerota archaeon]
MKPVSMALIVLLAVVMLSSPAAWAQGQYLVQAQAQPTQPLTPTATLLVPGGIQIAVVNPPAGLVDGAFISHSGSLNYELNTYPGLITFTTNETGIFSINATFDFPVNSTWEISITEYSITLDERLFIPFTIYGQNITFDVLVNSIVAPQYPTPQQIALALLQEQQSLLQNFTNIVDNNVTTQMSTYTSSTNSQIKSYVNSTNTWIEKANNAMNSLNVEMTGFTSAMQAVTLSIQKSINSWEANGMTSIMVIAAVVLIIVVSMWFATKRMFAEKDGDSEEILFPKDEQRKEEPKA